MRGPSRRPRGLTAATTAAALVLGGLLWVLLASSKPEQTAATPASRIDTQPRACLAAAASSSPQDTDRAWTGLKNAAQQNPQLVIQRFGAPASTTHVTFL